MNFAILKENKMPEHLKEVMKKAKENHKFMMEMLDKGVIKRVSEEIIFKNSEKRLEEK